MKRLLLLGLIVVPMSTGCMLTEKGMRATASVGIEGYSDHEERIAVKPDSDPIICKAWKFAFCKGVTAEKVEK